jgi:hypothetical protein
VVPGEWSTVLALHCSRNVATCPHLQALTTLPTCMSCRPMMTLMSDALETCARALRTCVPSYTDKSDRLFFMLEAHSRPRDVVAPKPTSAGRRGPESRDMWQRRSPPQLGSEVWSHRTRDSTGVHLDREVRSGAVGHVAAHGCTSCYLS